MPRTLDVGGAAAELLEAEELRAELAVVVDEERGQVAVRPVLHGVGRHDFEELDGAELARGRQQNLLQQTTFHHPETRQALTGVVRGAASKGLGRAWSMKTMDSEGLERMNVFLYVREFNQDAWHGGLPVLVKVHHDPARLAGLRHLLHPVGLGYFHHLTSPDEHTSQHAIGPATHGPYEGVSYIAEAFLDGLLPQLRYPLGTVLLQRRVVIQLVLPSHKSAYEPL